MCKEKSNTYLQLFVHVESYNIIKRRTLSHFKGKHYVTRTQLVVYFGSDTDMVFCCQIALWMSEGCR